MGGKTPKIPKNSYAPIWPVALLIPFIVLKKKAVLVAGSPWFFCSSNTFLVTWKQEVLDSNTIKTKASCSHNHFARLVSHETSYVINVLLNHPLDYNSKPKNMDKLAKLVHKNVNQKRCAVMKKYSNTASTGIKKVSNSHTVLIKCTWLTV